MIYVTSDIHGRMDCLQKLLRHVHFYDNEENWLYILGDVIDRNESGGVDILKWLLLQPNVQLLLGNHEQMLLSNRWVFQEVNDKNIEAIGAENIGLLGLWEANGGECTIKAFSKEAPEARQDILEYLDECPIIESVRAGGKNYVLVHSGLGNFSPDKDIYDYSADELLWERPNIETKYKPGEYTVVFGHTPTVYYSETHKNRILKTESWWDIDTGAALEDGKPMLLCLDNGYEYYIEAGRVVCEK